MTYRDPKRFDLSKPGYRVETTPPCECEECRPGPGIDYAALHRKREEDLRIENRRKRLARKLEELT